MALAPGDQGALQLAGLPTNPTQIAAALFASRHQTDMQLDPRADPQVVAPFANVEPRGSLPPLPLHTGVAPLITHPLAGIRRDFGANQNTSDLGPDLWADAKRVPYGYDPDVLLRWLQRRSLPPDAGGSFLA